MTISPKMLGAVRALLLLALFAAAHAVLAALATPAVASSLVGTTFSGFLVLIAGALEQHLADSSSNTTAIFGAVKVS